MYTLAWSTVHKTYILCDQHGEQDQVTDLNLPMWRAWLEQTVSFAFRGQSGTYTARKEQIKCNAWYWYAYQHSRKRVRKKYLGKSAALTLQRLEEIAAHFNDERSSEGGNVIAGMTAQATGTGQEQILAAKLRVPLTPRHLLMRSRLLSRLQVGPERPVTLICAPAGCGKSTLLSSWLRDTMLPSTWLSLDKADNDPARFWIYVFNALDKLYPGVGEQARQVLCFPPPNIEQALTPLINLLGDGQPIAQQEAGEALLVLDDYHVIDSEAVHRGMILLLEHLPPHLHLVISTRFDPPLPLARLRIYDRLLELRGADLRFNGEEMAAFFARQRGIALSAEELALLEERTAGWAVGLQLVALVLDDQRERVAILQGVDGSQHYIAEYLGREVLAQFPEQVQQFLLRTSILDQLEGGLCEAVSELPGGAQTLAELFQAGLFLTPLDESLRWYRYHQIFAEMLRMRLQQSAAAQIPELHRRASRWYREHQMLAEAVAHAYAANDLESIASIAEETGTELISKGETQMVMNWVAMLPRALVFSRLRLFLFECWWRWYAGRATVVAEMLREYAHLHKLPDLNVMDVAVLEQAVSAHVDLLYPRSCWDDEQRANRCAEILALYAVLNMQRVDGGAFSQAVCRRAVAHVAGLPHRARIMQHLGTIAIQRGELDEATTVLEEALASAIADENATWSTGIGYRLIALYEMMGRLHDIVYTAQELLQIITSKTYLTHGTAYILLGSVEYERNHLEAAERYCHLALACSEEVDILKEVDPYMHFLLGQLRLARIRYVRRDSTGARQCLAEIENFLRTPNRLGNEVLPVVQGEYALLMCELGDERPGRRWLEEFPPPEGGEQVLLRQFISLNHNHHLIYMKLLLAYQRWQEAERLVEDQQIRAERQGRTGSLIQWLALRALLKQERGDSEQALVAIRRALSLGERGGYTRSFLDAGKLLLPLFYRLHDELCKQQGGAGAVPTPGYLERLLVLLRQEQQASRSAGEWGELALVEPLSEREREVLWHISEGRTNREIAEQLVLAPSTVKSHIRAVYAKLGARSRTQALLQARRRGLL